MTETPSNWNKLSLADKARHFASEGSVLMVIDIARRGGLTELPESEQRMIIASSLRNLVTIRETQNSQGKWPKASIEDPEFAMTTADLSAKQLAKATEILWNPEGISLIQQIKTIF